MNLANLIEECERRSSFNDASFRPYWTTYLNAGIREFSRVHPWPGLEDFVTLYSTGSEFLVLPQYVGDVVHLFNKSDNVEVMCYGGWERDNPASYGQRSTGSVREYGKIGEVPAIRNPTDYLWLVSSNGSDISQLFLTGRVRNAQASGTAMEYTVQTASVYATGLSPVTISTLFSQLLSVSKESLTNGIYALFDQPGFPGSLVPVSYIDAFEQSASFRRIQLMYSPAATTQFELRFRYKIPPLVEYTQSPPPAVKPDFLINFALEQFYRHQGQFQQANVMRSVSNDVLEKEANKEHQFSEDYSKLEPYVEDDPDA